jgi:hypothetical protein
MADHPFEHRSEKPGMDRREFVKKLTLGAAFVVPAVATWELVAAKLTADAVTSDNNSTCFTSNSSGSISGQAGSGTDGGSGGGFGCAGSAGSGTAGGSGGGSGGGAPGGAPDGGVGGQIASPNVLGRVRPRRRF